MQRSASENVDSRGPVATALKDCRSAMWSVALFSGVVNILMLAGPLYMLQVYDRVLASRSVPTLVALSLFLFGAYAFQGVLDLIRSRIVVRAAALLDRHLGTIVHNAVIRIAVRAGRAGEAHQPVRDLDQIRSFLTGSGPIAIVDLPWMPIFLIICLLIHPWLGILSLVGAVMLFALTIFTERASRIPARTVAQDASYRIALLEGSRRNCETAVAMGMTDALAKRWSNTNHRYLMALRQASDIVGSYGSVTKIFRLMLQSAILGLGAYLVIRQELTAGAMIAASIMMGRALAPIETAIANLRGFMAARESIRRLSHTLARLPPSSGIQLPAPTQDLSVEHLSVVAPDTERPIVRNVHFRLVAGEVLGIIGPNSAGKTSLLRTLVGIWAPGHGTVRLDGAALDQWDPELLGHHIGFASQNAELFDGTIGENIARMRHDDGRDTAVFEAARAAGVHDMILRLPSGYDTPIGEGGTVLSGGQRQRVSLARALYRNPFLIVLDEPHANLDNDGELALQHAIGNARHRGAIVIIVANRPSALTVCDRVLFLANGVQQAFGPRDEMLAKVLVRS